MRERERGRERELIVLLGFCSKYHLAGFFLCLFSLVPWIGLSVAISHYTH